MTLRDVIQQLAGTFGYAIHRKATVDTWYQTQAQADGLRSALAEAQAHIERLQHEQAHARATASPAPPARRLFMDQYAREATGVQTHAAQAFSTEALRYIETLLPAAIEASVETGCGKSTILLSNLAQRHKVFALDDRDQGEGSSVAFYERCGLTRFDRIETIFGPTQRTLPRYQRHEPYDVVLIDGPHGYPFPDLEYYYLYPHLKRGGVLILDDVVIPTIGRLADFIAEDEMFELLEVVGGTAVFRRTDAETFDPHADGWWTQRYNRRRVSPNRDIHLSDGPVCNQITSLQTDRRMLG